MLWLTKTKFNFPDKRQSRKEEGGREHPPKNSSVAAPITHFSLVLLATSIVFKSKSLFGLSFWLG